MEELHCPHCGRINKHAQQHIRDMQRYHGEFEETKKEIYSVGKRYSQITVRAIIIVVLLIVLAVMALVQSQSYSIVRRWENNKAKRYMEEYMKQIDTYIEEEDFLALSSFFEYHDIDYYGVNEEYEVYLPVMRTVGYYDDIYYSVMRFASFPEEYSERQLTYLGDNLNEFYQLADRDYYSDSYREFNEGKCGKAVDTMKLYVEKLLHTYCNLTEEEAAGFEKLSNAKRMVLLEERMTNEK